MQTRSQCPPWSACNDVSDSNNTPCWGQERGAKGGRDPMSVQLLSPGSLGPILKWSLTKQVLNIPLREMAQSPPSTGNTGNWAENPRQCWIRCLSEFSLVPSCLPLQTPHLGRELQENVFCQHSSYPFGTQSPVSYRHQQWASGIPS